MQEGYRSIDARSLYQSTLLHTAAKHGHTELSRALLRRGADVNMLDYGGMRRSALHWACHGAHVALVELLLEAGADTTVGGYVSGSSEVLFCAARRGLRASGLAHQDHMLSLFVRRPMTKLQTLSTPVRVQQNYNC